MNEKELVEKKNDLITRAEETLNKAKEEKRELTDAEMQELAEIRDNVRKIVKAMDLYDDFDRICKEPKREVKEDEGGTEMTEEEKIKNEEEQETRAFENYVRGYALNERGTDYNLTKSANGAVIPTSIANRIIKRVYDISPILQRSQKFNVKGNLDLPYYDATSHTINVAYQTEFTDLESSVGEFKSVQLTGFLAGALVKVSRSLMNNSQFDIVGFVVDEMAYAISRFIEGELLNGTNDKVDGLSGLTNSLTAASGTAITSNELIEAQAKVKDIYQKDAIWIMSPATRTAIRQLKSTTGYYLLNEDITSPFGYTLLGKPVYVSDNMDDMAAGKTAIYYGDMSGLATKFNEEINIQVLRERYATQHADAVVGWFEFDSKVQDGQKIAKVVMAGSTPSV